MANSKNESLIGTRVGDYQILRRLGAGGMAEVYAARQLNLSRDVAIKFLRSDFARDKNYVRRFRREALAAAKLNHPNIVTVFDVGEHQDIPFIVQELIDGENLRERLDRDGAFDPSVVREVLVSVADALGEAASVGIVHRDIKPENIMCSSRGLFKVADFGLARVSLPTDQSEGEITAAGLTLGTPRYMSPEQISGKTVDIRGDLYSLGVTGYHLLTGRPPFEAEDPVALAVMHTHETPKPIEMVRREATGDRDETIDDDLIVVINRLLEKSPEDRYDSPDDMIAQLQRNTDRSVASSGRFGLATQLQRATSRADRFQRRRRRRRVLGALAFAVITASTFLLVRANQMSDITEWMNPNRVPQKATVIEQYLWAMKVDDPAAYRAIEEYFPPAQSQYNREYAIKANLQLARHLEKRGRDGEALTLLESIAADPDLPRPLFRAIALAQLYEVSDRLYQIALQNGDTPSPDDRDKYFRQLQLEYERMKQGDPADVVRLRKLLPPELRSKLT